MATLRVTPTLNLTTSIPSIHPSSSSSSSSSSKFSTKLKVPLCKPLSLSLSRKQSQSPFIVKATETNNEAENPTTTNEATDQQQQQQQQQISELGEEIKKAMKERENKAEDSGGFLSGVIEEIGEIEWPEFGKVIGTTGVVLGVIAGSSVVLLTLNAVLAELSDKVFAGRGVQDFFGG